MPSTRKRTIGCVIVALCALIGAIDSGALAYDHQASLLDPDHQSGICTKGSSCEISRDPTVAVNRIPMPAGWPDIPISIPGLACYLVVLFMLVGVWRQRDEIYERLLFWVATASVLLTLFLASYSLIKQGSLCPFCAILYAVSIGVFIGAIMVLKDGVRSVFKGVAGTLFTKQAAIVLGLFLMFNGVAYAVYMKPLKQTGQMRMEAQATQLADSKRYDLALTDRPTEGVQGAAVHIIEFGDYRCPHCKDLYVNLHTLMKKRPKDLKITMLHFPLDGCHPKLGTCLVSRVVECAHRQGKFNAIAEWAFDNGRGLTMEAAVKAASERGIDTDKLKTCVDDPAILERIMADRKLGESLEIKGTPTFLVNGRKVVGPRPLSILELMVDTMKKHPSPHAK